MQRLAAVSRPMISASSSTGKIPPLSLPEIAARRADMQFTDYTDHAESVICGQHLWDDAPVVVGSDWHRLVFFDPVDDQLADLFARAIDDGRVLVHDVATAAVHPVIIRGETKFFRGRQWLAAKAQVLYSLSDGF